MDRSASSDEILKTLLAYSELDFSGQIPLPLAEDDLQAIAVGINNLGEEFRSYVEALEKAGKDIRHRQLRFETILNTVQEAVVISDEKGRILIWNAAASTIFGYTVEDVPTLSLTDLMHPDLRSHFLNRLKRFVDTGDRTDLIGTLCECPGIRKSGAEFPMEFNINSWKAEGTPFFIAVIRDITDRHMADQAIQRAYAELQAANEELQSQQEELRKANAELQINTIALKQQQEELEALNEEMEEQQQQIEEKNHRLEEARLALQTKNEDLELTSRYKSEFLANMSHELRSPLNSLLILANDLKENKRGHLDAQEAESAAIIHESGLNLLQIINDILDLSKIEAGKLEIDLEQVRIKDVVHTLESTFRRPALERSQTLTFNIGPEVPQRMRSNRQRLTQILINLLSNAQKFTPTNGAVTVDISCQDDLMRFAVSDTGIGIPKEKYRLIFEAFEQADRGTTRKFGGTGLGLSIASQLCGLLGGHIELDSSEGQGSTFTVILPVHPGEAGSDPDQGVTDEEVRAPAPTHATNMTDFSKQTLLVIEDDQGFAEILCHQARQSGFRCLAASKGMDGIRMAHQHRPNAIMLDLALPDMNGYDVLNVLKSDPQLSHIPVHVLSVGGDLNASLEAGAVGHVSKPIDRDGLNALLQRMTGQKSTDQRVLIADADAVARHEIRQALHTLAVTVDECASLEALQETWDPELFDILISELVFEDGDARRWMQDALSNADQTVIIYTRVALSESDLLALSDITRSVISKGALAMERLVDEAALFLKFAARPANNTLTRPRFENALLGKRVLLVDDDMRNLFALSRALQDEGLVVIKAENGEKALEILHSQFADDADVRNSEGHIDAILMDIMMPEMDGFECISHIRMNPAWADTPIIALTAKAMKEDREKCLAVGASDYLSKPIDVDRLLSLLKMWTQEQPNNL